MMKRMKTTIVGLAAAAGVMLSSCASGPYADNQNSKSGAVLGGLLGAGAGAIIGNQSGRPLEGAAIGAAAGGLGGAALGSSKDDENARNREAAARQRQQQQQYYNQQQNTGGYYQPRY